MATLAFALLLTAVTMARADQMSDVLKLPPHKDIIYVFDVTSEASVQDLKGALKDFTIEGAYKIIGENRFFFEVISNDTTALRALTFPEGTHVTQRPVEHISKYVDMFGGEKGSKEGEEKLSDTVLLYIEKEKRIPETMCTKTFAMEVKEWTRFLAHPKFQVMNKIYHELTSYPPRAFAFSRLEENAVQNVIKTSFDKAGGYGAAQFQTKRAVKI